MFGERENEKKKKNLTNGREKGGREKRKEERRNERVLLCVYVCNIGVSLFANANFFFSKKQ